MYGIPSVDYLTISSRYLVIFCPSRINHNDRIGSTHLQKEKMTESPVIIYLTVTLSNIRETM